MRLLAIALISVFAFTARPTAKAQQFLKLDKPASVFVAQTTTSSAEAIKPVKPAENASEAKLPETSPVATSKPSPVQPANCQADQWIRADNGQCIDKPKTQVSARVKTRVTVRPTGNKQDWMRQAGIPEDQWRYVDYIVSRESGWNPCAYNPGRSDCNANPKTACGLAQSLPCGKQSKYGHWTDPVANLKWQYEYVTGRYGGYAGAYSFWVKNHWY